MSRILFVATSASKSLLGAPTGYFLPEAAHPYYILSPHFAIDIATPSGTKPPLDPASVEFSKGDEAFLESAKPLSAVNPDDYIAVFYVGGHGPVIDLATDETNIQLANKFYRDGKLVSAVCHGTAALVGVTGVDGKSIFYGKTVTGFSNAEEEQIGKVKVKRHVCQSSVAIPTGEFQDIPFLLEDRIPTLGGTNLITGQNPGSSGPIAQEVLKTLLAKS
ncbi:class I glutamine amidotransferase-like protein [Multifurca ochricompacta]|uniref:D-lactate dehydratase n=1 Tax=Multifurca ochricompacta TaxID=376703 RepID=A0AAD4QPH4_9AGAM|nr:class I glutamine amidotransferase-like protein [Multifurca ochricompacta]